MRLKKITGQEVPNYELQYRVRMSKVKKGIYGALRGSFLTDETSFKNWRIILFVVALLLIMISSSHSVYKKSIKISELNKKKRSLTAEYVDTKTTLMQMQMESSVREQAEKIGLVPSEDPPKKIKVIVKK